MTDTCHKCGQPIKDGDLVTGLTWSGDGGAHVNCPKKPEDVTEQAEVEYCGA